MAVDDLELCAHVSRELCLLRLGVLCRYGFGTTLCNAREPRTRQDQNLCRVDRGPVLAVDTCDGAHVALDDRGLIVVQLAQKCLSGHTLAVNSLVWHFKALQEHIKGT